MKLTPGTRRLVVSIAGKPGVELGPAQVAVFGKIFGTNGSARKLSIQPSGSAFAIGDELKTGQEIELEIREKRKDGKKEVLKMEAP